MPSVRTLTVAGGGGGGGSQGGGGGAGGMQDTNKDIDNFHAYNIQVGSGGSPNTSGQNSWIKKIEDSSVLIESIGGGYGGQHYSGGDGQDGGDGGSGGGGGGANTGDSEGFGGSGTSGQGNDGASGKESNSLGAPNDADPVGGGGGGAGSAGQIGGDHDGGDGGDGLASDITGTSVTYAAGAGGDPNSSNGTGHGNPGSGGALDQDGYDGIVIIRYNPDDFTHAWTGGTITEVDGDKVHTFTSDGTLEPVLSGAGSFML